MTKIPHWKITAAMVAAYLPVVALVLLFLHDAAAGILLLFVAFFLILLAGNMVLRRNETASRPIASPNGRIRPSGPRADPELSVRRPPEGGNE